MDVASISWKISVGNRIALLQEESAGAILRHVPTQSYPAELISSGVEHTTLLTYTLWWEGPQWLTLQPSSWPKTVFNTHSINLEIRNVHLACLQPPEGITQNSFI